MWLKLISVTYLQYECFESRGAYRDFPNVILITPGRLGCQRILLSSTVVSVFRSLPSFFICSNSSTTAASVPMATKRQCTSGKQDLALLDESCSENSESSDSSRSESK